LHFCIFAQIYFSILALLHFYIKNSIIFAQKLFKKVLYG